MNTRFHYILAGFILLIIYLFYSIITFKFNQFRIDNFMENIIVKNHETEMRNKRKENMEKYIYTNAYRSQVAKATQNKKLPGEEIINVIKQEDIDGNANIDSQEVFSDVHKRQDDPTAKMSNIERWKYLFEK